jgi:3-phenylpropionate/trans-cinnamate dioxygenase ferredoxin reductase subunit
MVIIGAGECGTRAAFALREAGYDGAVTLVGAEAHLPYERPPLSKEAMTAPETPAIKAISDAARLSEHRIDLFGAISATSIDRANRSIRLSDGSDLDYDKLLIATGAVPRRLPLSGLGPRCVYLRTFDDALAIRAHLRQGCHVAIIGGGFIGLELAASARKLGAEVTVIEAQPRILMRGVPEEIATFVHEAHAAEGVDIICGDGIAAIDDGTSVRIALSSGQQVAAGLAIISIGAVPVTALAESAGLTLNNGIAVDIRLRTSDPNIFAAGDCCSFPLAVYGERRVRLEAWRSAQEHGALAARNMLGADEAHAAVPWFWSDQYGLSLQIAGLPDEGEHTVRRDLDDGAFILFHLKHDGRLVAASGIGPGNAVARDIRLAEMLIARSAHPDIDALAAPSVKLKSLLAA